MNLHVASLCLLSVLPSLVMSSRVLGRFGSLVIPLDFQFGKNTMIITSHIPSSAPPSLRPTSNLHIFSERLVAIRNEKDRKCYLQKFDATMEGMKAKVQDALQKNGYFEGVKEEMIFTGNMDPLPRRIVAQLGMEIKQFCDPFDVYYVDDSNSQLVPPPGATALKRKRRFIAGDIGVSARIAPMVLPNPDGSYPKRPWRPIKWPFGEGVLIMC